jgi:hypothetical protein
MSHEIIGPYTPYRDQHLDTLYKMAVGQER